MKRKMSGGIRVDGRGGGVRVNVKIQKKKIRGGGGVRVNVKIQKKKLGGGGSGGGGRGGCEWSSEAFVKIKKKKFYFFFFGGGGRVRGGVGWGSQGGWER